MFVLLPAWFVALGAVVAIRVRAIAAGWILMSELVSIEAIVGAWTDTVTDAVKPETASVWLRPLEPFQSERHDRSF